MKVFSSIFFNFAENLMSLLFILLAKGWTISKRKLSKNVYLNYLLE